MQEIKLSPNVRQVTVLTRDADGQTRPVVVFEREKTRKRQSRWLKPAERAVRRAAQAERSAVDSYLARHDRSNSKRRNGWLRDLNVNLLRAGRKGVRQLRLARVIIP